VLTSTIALRLQRSTGWSACRGFSSMRTLGPGGSYIPAFVSLEVDVRDPRFADSEGRKEIIDGCIDETR